MFIIVQFMISRRCYPHQTGINAVHARPRDQTNRQRHLSAAIFPSAHAQADRRRAQFSRLFQRRNTNNTENWSVPRERESYRERAMDDDLVCNYRSCRKRLSNYAWVWLRIVCVAKSFLFLHTQVTSCSRILSISCVLCVFENSLLD